MLAIALTGCSGSDGSDGAPGPAGPPGTGAVVSPTSTTALTINITSVTISSPPVVNFTVTNQDGVAVAGLTLDDLRFTIAKLVPGSNGAPSKWQNYINTASSGLTGGYVRGNREGGTTGTLIGTMVDNKDGNYTYTFKTDITNTAQTCPTSPCIDADGNTIDTSYNASLTHRVAIQTRGTLPMVNGVYTFIPGSGPVTSTREIVKTEKCNECHNKLVAHDARIDTQYCVMCHNPGSTAKGQVGTAVGPITVDFKVMIHKIHHGDALPSVLDPDGNPATTTKGDYGIIGFSGSLTGFGDVAFPQDIRNCTKCHDGTPPQGTAQGDNWKTQPSKAACSSCHDDVYFGAAPDPLKPYQTVSHATLSGVTDVAESTCTLCHGAGKPEDVAVKHTIPSKVVRGNFKFNILEICGIPVVNGVANTFGVAGCQAGQLPTVKFSVTDPTGGTHGYSSSRYNIFADPEFWNSAAVPPAPRASMSVDIAWDTRDYTNKDGSQARPGRANQFNVYGTTAASTPYGQPANSLAAYPAAVSNGDGTYTLTAATPIPASATGSGAVALEGRAFNPLAGLTATEARVPIKGEVAYFAITDSTPQARRVVADATGKCDKCHDQLSLHGGSRNDNVQLCVLCHNPSNTDAQASARPKDPTFTPSNDLPIINSASLLMDGKKEESVDLKRMIHGIHAAGMREKSIWIAGTNFANVFPGILSDCTTCHTGTTYQLTGIWETPTQNGILGSTIDATPTMVPGVSTKLQVDAALNDPTDDLKISPTAAVCTSCHDDPAKQTHMVSWGLANFMGTQATIDSSPELCSLCHGPGGILDVKVVHGVK
jgi:OmcA/MtrC family decaheme c-type cytochrome